MHELELIKKERLENLNQILDLYRSTSRKSKRVLEIILVLAGVALYWTLFDLLDGFWGFVLTIASFNSAKQLADTNDLKQEYLLYRTYSSETHMSLNVLTQNFETTPLGVYFDADFRIDNFKDDICILISVVIRPLEFFVENYCEDNRLKTKFYAFMGNYVETFK